MALEKTFAKGDRLTASDLNSIVSAVNKNANMVNITYTELKTLRDNSQLIPGATYRITDYICTTSQADTQSACHIFDILVTADDVNRLNENARAIQHRGDPYFDGSDLSAWELKYCLDNDTTRFSWAVTGTTGRGVIYYMKDEWNNECPYDFKNIQFARYQITDCQNAPDLVGQYSVNSINGITVNTGTPYYCYTFTVKVKTFIHDVSTRQDFIAAEGTYFKTQNNVIKEYYKFNENDTSQYLALLNNVFMTDDEILNDINGFFGYYNNVFGNDCYNNTVGGNSNNNVFRNNCYNNTFGNECCSNTFGNYCYSNTFGNNCSNNTFGNYCSNNISKYNFRYNKFENDCNINKIGYNCIKNVFGNNFTNNTIGNNFQHNTFGNNCTTNTFSNTFQLNTIENNFQHNTFITDFIKHCTFFNGIMYLKVTVTTSTASFLQNLQISNGCQGTSGSILTINTQVTSNRPFTTLIGKNTNNIITFKPNIS